MSVAKFTLHLHLDDALLDRLRTAAEQRGCSVEALIAQWLHEHLPADPGALDTSGATAEPLSQEEAAFLHEMERALDEVPAGKPPPWPGRTEPEESGT